MTGCKSLLWEPQRATLCAELATAVWERHGALLAVSWRITSAFLRRTLWVPKLGEIAFPSPVSVLRQTQRRLASGVSLKLTFFPGIWCNKKKTTHGGKCLRRCCFAQRAFTPRFELAMSVWRGCSDHWCFREDPQTCCRVRHRFCATLGGGPESWGHTEGAAYTPTWHSSSVW